MAVNPRPFDPHCQACPRLATYLGGIRSRFPDYHAQPVAAFGPESARLLIVGLAPGMHGANRTGRPFTGDVSGTLLFSTLHELGLSSSALATSANDGMRLIDCRITNAVRCVPPGNKPSAAEVNRCSGFLAYDLDRLYRDGRRQAAVAVLALGHVAHDAVLNVLDERQVDWPFGHGALHEPRPGLALVDSYHPSRQNTNTGRLTTAMFRDAVARAVEFIG